MLDFTEFTKPVQATTLDDQHAAWATVRCVTVRRGEEADQEGSRGRLISQIRALQLSGMGEGPADVGAFLSRIRFGV